MLIIYFNNQNWSHKNYPTDIENQSIILNELNKDTKNLKDLSSEERNIEEDYKNLQHIMKDAQIASEQLCLPLYPGLKKSEIQYVADSLKKTIKKLI